MITFFFLFIFATDLVRVWTGEGGGEVVGGGGSGPDARLETLLWSDSGGEQKTMIYS